MILTPYRGQKQAVLELAQKEDSKVRKFLSPSTEGEGTLYVRTINECQG